MRFQPLLSWLLVVCATGLCLGQDEKPVIKLWPEGLPEGSKQYSAEAAKELRAKTTPERIAFVDDPTLTVYRAPEEKANGAAVVVCPGGGYHILAWPKEGLEIAEWFNSFGVTAAVLEYRVPRRDPDQPHVEPLQDAQRAIRVVRHRAKDWKVDPARIGILGFSAGGHLTVMAGLHWGRKTYGKVDEADELSCRPDFVIPIYAAYLGSKDDETRLDPLVKVTAETPPMFLAVTWDDKWRGLHSALLFAELKKAGVPAELHIYSKGGHGYGIRPSDNPVCTWHRRCEEWMKASGLCGPGQRK
jgi:acetyl esterase/lipase